MEMNEKIPYTEPEMEVIEIGNDVLSTSNTTNNFLDEDPLNNNP